MKRGAVFVAPLVGISLVVALLWILNQSSAGQPIVRAAGFTVCPAGPPLCSFSSIQAAVDAASNGDVIKVATGVYTDVHTRPRNDRETTGLVTQVVYLTKSLTLRGGYTTSFDDPPNPVLNATVLDAQGRGRVLYITSADNVTLEGFQITGGDALGLHGDPFSLFGNGDAGGGGYVISSTVTFRNNHVFFNTTVDAGGGLLVYRSTATLAGNIITGNTVTGHSALGCCEGGGAVLYDSVVTFTDNTVFANSAPRIGGLEVTHGRVMIFGNRFSNNWGSLYCSGVWIDRADQATLIDNTITGNGPSCGLRIEGTSHVLVVGNTITGNSSGLYIRNTRGEVSGNTISDNSAGGVGLSGEAPVLTANVITGNTAYDGGGVNLQGVTNTVPILINNLIANNSATHVGSGIYIYASPVQLLQTTLASNTGGDGSGIYITATPGGVILTNTILVSQTLGITATTDSSITLDSILWFNNGANTGGSGFISITHAITGDPQFALDGFHIMSGSAAIDAGRGAYIYTDIDNEPRPYQSPDLGADEYWPPGTLQQVYLPLLVRN